MTKRLNISIQYADPNAKEVQSLVEAFKAAGKFKETGKAMSMMTYDVGGTVSDTTPVSADEIEQLKKLGATVKF